MFVLEDHTTAIVIREWPWCHPSQECFWGSCLGPWPNYSQGLCWYLWFLILLKVMLISRVWATTWGHVSVQRSHCHGDHAKLRGAASWGHGNVRVQAADKKKTRKKNKGQVMYMLISLCESSFETEWDLINLGSHRVLNTGWLCSPYELIKLIDAFYLLTHRTENH